MFSQSGRAFGRQSYVGLEGGFGRLTLGRQYSPNFELQSFTDAFGNTFVGNVANLEQSDARVDNAVIYATPTIAGLRGQILVAPSEGTSAGRQINLAVTYSANQLYLAASTIEVKNAIATGHVSLVGGSYDFKIIRAFANYMYLENIQPASDASNPAATAAPFVQVGAKGASWNAGVLVPIGTGRLIASYTSLDDKRAVNHDAQMYAIAYEYFLSKRTSLYGAAARIVNKNGGVMVVSTPSVVGQGQQQATLGITHRF